AERSTLLPAAPARAVDQLAVLAGPRHRIEVLPDDGPPPGSPKRYPGTLQLLERIRRVSAAAGGIALHRQRQEALVGSAAAPDLRHARIPGLRCPDLTTGDGRPG